MDRVLAAAVIGVTLVGFIAASSTTRTPAQAEFALGWAFHLGGGLVALVAAAGLLGQWLRGAPADRLVPGVVVLLAGLAVAAPAWPVAGLGVVAAAVAVAGRRGAAPSERGP